jgi:DMSO/TMAO reductase YedYZ molybdopterin-dependent catalytic subunit
VAAFAGVTGVLGSYAVAGSTRDFVASPLADALTRGAPGAVVTAGLLAFGDAGKLLVALAALGLAVGLLAGASLLGLVVAVRASRPGRGAPAAGVLTWAATASVTGAPVAAVGAAAGAGLAVALARRGRPVGGDGSTSTVRRRVLGGVAALGVGALAAGLRRLSPRSGGDDASRGLADGPAADKGTDPAVRSRLEAAAERSLDVPGLEPLVSTEFYRVDINTVAPSVAVADWSLTLTGAVDREVTLTYEDVTSMPVEHRFVTLRCVGESLNGRKMDTALWTGTPAAPLVDRAGPVGDCECVMLRAADGYYEEFPLAALRGGLLAFGMNGQRLPRAHGHPLRALIPGHWGEINVKWLTEIEFLEREAKGYWEKRGWHGTGPVNTVAKLHAVNRRDGGRIQVGGHAYAGTRGVDRVEVSVDGGEWERATLSEPLPDPDVWRQWAYEYDSPGRTHEVVVRAVERDGTVQPRAESGAFPSGPSGWVRKTIRP